MARIPGIRKLFRLPASEGRVTGEVDDEIAFHLEERARELAARGMEPAAARAEALREFGDVGEARAELEAIGKRRVRRVERSTWWSDLRQDVRYTARALARTPGFTLVAVLTLALGIGATTSIFTVVDGVLLRPLGVAAADELVVIREQALDHEGPPRLHGSVSPANFFDWRERSRSFEDLSYFVQSPTNLTGGGEPQEAQAQLVSADFFETLGVQPLLGRTFLPEEDDAPDTGDVAVLSHRLWATRYGSDPGIVGQTVRVNDTPLVVVGVMGPDFRVLDGTPDLWIPFYLPAGDRTTMGRFLTGIGRLKPGVGIEQAQEEMSGIARQLAEEFPASNTGMDVRLMSLREAVVGEVRPALLVLLGAVSILLLIACTNVANLLLGRASVRRREIAVRLSLGATRGRLVRQLLTESVVLSLVGGVLGLAAAAVGTRALVRSLPESVQLPRLDTVGVDGRVLAFALGVAVLTGVVFGLAPALVSSRQDLQGSLRDASRGNTGGRAPMRLRSGLVVAEVGLALMLLVGAGLMLRSFQKLQAVDTGMVSDGVLTLRLSLGGEQYADPSAVAAFANGLIPALEALPGVQAAGTVNHLPLTMDKIGDSARRADRPVPAPGEEPGTDFRMISGDYFAAQGIRLVREQFDPGEDPIGKRLVYDWGEPTEVEIVGVVEDVRETSVTDPSAAAVYFPLAQFPEGRLNVIVRTTRDPLALAGPAREVVRRLDPNLPVSSVRTMDAVLARATARSRLSGYLLGAFAALALLLAAIGLYGIISYGVAQRRGEIGVRVALGADRARILRLIVGQGMALTATGLVLGLLGALALSRLLSSLLFGVTTTDLTTYAAVPLILAGVAALASYLPASRAARVDPVVALRAE